MRVNQQLARELAAVDLHNLGQRLRQARLAKSMTQSQVAESIVSLAYVSRLEAGQRRPDSRILTRLADRLDTTVEFLVLGKVHDTHGMVQLHLEHAELAIVSGNPREAGRAIADARRVGNMDEDQHRRATVLQARLAEIAGDLESAILQLEDLPAPDPYDLAWIRARVALCRCYREAGDLTRSILTGESTLDTVKATHFAASDESVQLLVTIAAAYYEQGDERHAMRLCRRALEQAEALGTVASRAAAYWNASAMEVKRGSVQDALSLARKALSLLENMEDTRNLAKLRTLLGILLLRTDPPDLTAAQETLELADRELTGSGASVIDVARTRVALGRTALMAGDPTSAQTIVEQALATVPASAQVLSADAFALLGRIASHRGDQDVAKTMYRQAVHILTALGADRGAAQLWYELGGLLQEVGDTEASRDAFQRSAASTGLVDWQATRRRVQPTQR